MADTLGFRPLPHGQRAQSEPPPPHPPPTYLWEEIRKSRARGHYPWTHLFKPPYSEEEWIKEHDHEYEPIQAPAHRAASQPDVRSAHIEVKTQHIEQRELTAHRPLEAPKREEEERYEVVKPQSVAQPEEVITILQTEGGYEAVEQPKKPRRVIRIPNENAVIIPLHGSSDEEINPDRYHNPALMVNEDELDAAPRVMPEIHVHPAESTSKDVAEQEAPQRESFQGRIRSQADKFRNKMKGISKPKISMPQRPNLKMPEMPKFKLPEKPKFSLPERPKFHLPERPKFHFPERPKFHLPEKPKFLTERPKFKFGQEKKPKAPKGKKPNPSSLRRPLRDVVTISSQSTPGSTQNIFETLKFRTYPRFFKKKKKEQLEQKMSSFETESSQPSTPPPPRAKSHAPHQDTEWVTAYRGFKYADEDEDTDVGPRGERISMPDFQDKEENQIQSHDSYLGNTTNLESTVPKAESINSVASEKGSSGSSSNRRRAGVIEEIDSDEFFVRQKGLSREDVDVSRYLSLEIRDAFRQPKNALANLDNELYDDDEQDEPEIKFSEIPRSPQRKKSVDSGREIEFHTFPKRPSRRKESDPEKPPRRFRSRSGGRFRKRQSSMPSLEGDLDVVGAPEPPQRRKSTKSLNRDQAIENEEEIVQTRITARSSGEIPPVAPLRKSRSRGTSLADDDRTSRGADSAILPDDDDDDLVDQCIERVEIHIDDEIKAESFDEEVEEEEKNYRTEEPVGIIVESLKTPEAHAELPGYAVVAKGKKKPPRPPPPPRSQHHFDFQSQLDTIKSTGKNIFFTYPRRAIKSLHKPPVRPTRNYSTLGPLRPPRRNRVFRQPVYMKGDNQAQHEDSIEKERDLQSGEVVMRMKGRPLPPPPRPPRRSKDYDILSEVEKTECIATESETIIGSVETEIELEREAYDCKERSNNFKSKRDEFFNSLTRFKPFRKQKQTEESSKEEVVQTGPDSITTTGQQTSFDIGEVSVSIQTDPLPKGVIVIDQEIEESEEIFILHNQPIEREEKKLENEEFEEKTVISDEIKVSFTSPEVSIPEPQEPNIFQHALERVEAARGVLQEARERVIPGSLSSKSEDKKMTTEVKEDSARVTQKEALSTSPRSADLEKEETPPPFPTRPPYTKPIPVSFPDKLHLSELEVEKLNVSELQANKIKVLEIETASLDVTDINARSGNLNLSGLEITPEILSNLLTQVMSHAQQHQQQLASLQKSRESTPQRQARTVLTPPPSIVVQATAEPVQLPEPIVVETVVREQIPQPRTTRNKGRKSPTRVIDDSEDELAAIMPTRRKEQEKKKDDPVVSKPDVPKVENPAGQKFEDPSVPTLVEASSLQLMRQLFSLWQDHVARGASSFVEGVNSLFPEGEKRRDAQIAAIILLVLITGLILLGFGFDNSVHHHHWDYLPPR